MDEHSLAALAAQLLGLPRYAPRIARDAAGLVLLAVLVLSPRTFASAIDIAVQHATDRIGHRLEPILPDLLATDPAQTVSPQVGGE